MPKSRIMSAGTVGTSKRIRVNGPEGGGDKLQGLPPICNMRSPLVPYVRTRADGENRNVVFCINQLSGGVGAKRGQFGPGNRAGVGQTGGCATAMTTGQAYAILQNYFKGLNVVLVGIYETVQADLGKYKSHLHDYTDIRHYASFTNEHNAKNNYYGISDQQVREAIDVLNSIGFYGTANMISASGASIATLQRHIVGTATDASLKALNDEDYGTTLDLTDNKVISALAKSDAITITSLTYPLENIADSKVYHLGIRIRNTDDNGSEIRDNTWSSWDAASPFVLDYDGQGTLYPREKVWGEKSCPGDALTAGFPYPGTTSPRNFAIFTERNTGDHWIAFEYVPNYKLQNGLNPFAGSILRIIRVERAENKSGGESNLSKAWTTNDTKNADNFGELYFTGDDDTDKDTLDVAQQLRASLSQVIDNCREATNIPVFSGQWGKLADDHSALRSAVG